MPAPLSFTLCRVASHFSFCPTHLTDPGAGESLRVTSALLQPGCTRRQVVWDCSSSRWVPLPVESLSAQEQVQGTGTCPPSPLSPADPGPLCSSFPQPQKKRGKSGWDGSGRRVFPSVPRGRSREDEEGGWEGKGVASSTQEKGEGAEKGSAATRVAYIAAPTAPYLKSWIQLCENPMKFCMYKIHFEIQQYKHNCLTSIFFIYVGQLLVSFWEQLKAEGIIVHVWLCECVRVRERSAKVTFWNSPCFLLSSVSYTEWNQLSKASVAWVLMRTAGGDPLL